MTVSVFQPSTVVSSQTETESTKATPSTVLPTTTDFDSTDDFSNEIVTNNPRASIGTDSVEGNSTAIAVGGVAVILLLVLVGVVLGWVWTCHRIKGRKEQ